MVPTCQSVPAPRTVTRPLNSGTAADGRAVRHTRDGYRWLTAGVAGRYTHWSHNGTSVRSGVDTHAAVHVAAALHQLGRLLGTRSVSSAPAGYTALLTWARRCGTLARFGIERTASHRAPLVRSPLEQVCCK